MHRESLRPVALNGPLPHLCTSNHHLFLTDCPSLWALATQSEQFRLSGSAIGQCSAIDGRFPRATGHFAKSASQQGPLNPNLQSVARFVSHPCYCEYRDLVFKPMHLFLYSQANCYRSACPWGAFWMLRPPHGRQFFSFFRIPDPEKHHEQHSPARDTREAKR